MGIRVLNPVTPSMRGTVLVSRSGLWSGKPEKSLVVGAVGCSGRNVHGRITVRHRGGGHKRRYRVVDFARSKFEISAVVVRIEYDPNRTAFIALIRYDDGVLSYILAPVGLKIGDVVVSSMIRMVDVVPGNCAPLRFIPVGTSVHNIELRPGAGGVLIRAAGTEAKIVGRDGRYIILRLRSGEIRLVLAECLATVGVVSNADNRNIRIGKAGRNRWLGRRPSVRGVAMNPIDHPHGGGEGKTSGGRHPVTPWGVSTKGKKTRTKRKSSSVYIRKVSGRG